MKLNRLFILLYLLCAIATSCNKEDEPILGIEEGPYIEDIAQHNLDLQTELFNDLVGDYSSLEYKWELINKFGKSFGQYTEEYIGKNLPPFQDVAFCLNDVKSFDNSMIFEIKPALNIGGITFITKIGVPYYDAELINKVTRVRGFYISGHFEEVEMWGDVNTMNINIRYSPNSFELIPMKNEREVKNSQTNKTL